MLMLLISAIFFLYVKYFLVFKKIMNNNSKSSNLTASIRSLCANYKTVNNEVSNITEDFTEVQEDAIIFLIIIILFLST